MSNTKQCNNTTYQVFDMIIVDTDTDVSRLIISERVKLIYPQLLDLNTEELIGVCEEIIKMANEYEDARSYMQHTRYEEPLYQEYEEPDFWYLTQ